MREMRQDEGNAATTTGGYCSNSGGKADSNSGGKRKGSATTTAGYRGNGGGSNKDDSKGNSGKNGEPGMEAASFISLLFSIFLLGSGHGHKVRFFAQYNCHIMRHKPQYACTRDLAYFVQ